MEMNFNSLLIEVLCLSFDDGDGILGAMSQTGSQAVAEFFADQLRLSVNNLKGSLSTVGNAEPTAIALLLINLYNLSCRHCLFLPFIFLRKR